MKVYTNITLVWDEAQQAFVEEGSESYEYEGPVAKAISLGDVTDLFSGGLNTMGSGIKSVFDNLNLGGNQGERVQTQEPWKPQQPYLKDLFKRADALWQRGAPGSEQSNAALQDYINTLQATNQNLTPFLNETQQAHQFLLGDVLRPESNPSLQAYMDMSNRAISKNFNEQTLPNLTSQAAAAGGIGSSRQGVAEALASRDLMDTLQRNTSQLANQGYQSGLNAYTKGLATAPQTVALQTTPADLAKSIYGAQDVLETKDANREAQQLKLYQQLTGGNFGSTSTVPYESGGIAGALGGLSTGAGIVSAMPSAMSSWNPWIMGATTLAGLMS